MSNKTYCISHDTLTGLKSVEKVVYNSKIHQLGNIADEHSNFTFTECFDYLENNYPEYKKSFNTLNKIRDEINSQSNNVGKCDVNSQKFTDREKINYYSNRINDKSLNSKQRNFALLRLKKLKKD